MHRKEDKKFLVGQHLPKISKYNIFCQDFVNYLITAEDSLKDYYKLPFCYFPILRFAGQEVGKTRLFPAGLQRQLGNHNKGE